MDNQKQSRILSFEDFVSQGLDNQPDANIHMDQPHGHQEMPAPAQEPMNHDPQANEPNLMMMDEPTNTETEVDTNFSGDDTQQTDPNDQPTEEPNDVQDNDGQNLDLL